MEVFKSSKAFYIIALILFILDQIIKFIVHAKMSLGQSLPLINGIFHITYVQNTGAAFGILKGQNFLFIMISIVALIIIVFFHKDLLKENLPVSSGLSVRIAYGLILGGIVSNLFDRIRVGYVIDFLDFQVWPVFNLADSGVSIGAFLLIIKLLKK